MPLRFLQTPLLGPVLHPVQTATVTNGSTHTTDASLGSYMDLTASGATATIAVPTGGVNRQTLEYAVYNSSGGSNTTTFNASIKLSTGLSSSAFTVAAGKVLYASLKYTTLGSLNQWTLVAAAVSA